jgi:Uma2 family endonuclease
MTQTLEPATNLGLWKFSVEQYHALIQSGILDEDTPIELLEGWLVEKMSKNPPHRYSMNAVRRLLERVLRPGLFINTQDPVTLEDSEPEPDLSLIRGEETAYLTRHPHAHEIALIVEISDSSLKRDQGWKKRVYATACIEQYWILNLEARQLEVYTQPANGDYTKLEPFEASSTAQVTLEGQTLSVVVADLLPE